MVYFTGQHFFAPAKKRWQRNRLTFFSQKKERNRKKLAPRFCFVRYAVIYYTISLLHFLSSIILSAQPITAPLFPNSPTCVTLLRHAEPYQTPVMWLTAIMSVTFFELDLLNCCNVVDCGNVFYRTIVHLCFLYKSITLTGAK